MSKMATRSASTEVDEAVSCSNGNSDIIDVDGEVDGNADTGLDDVINKNGIQLTSTLQHVSGTLNLFTHDDTSSDSNDLNQTHDHSPRKFPFHKDLCDVRTGLPVSDDLRHGYRVLKELSMTSCRSVNTIFMTDLGSTPVNPVLMNPQLPPLTLPIIQRKFENSEYATLTNFVRDFRVMLERSIRYFGPEHSAVKKIQKFETMLEQKLALLKRKYQDMTTIEMTHPSALSDVTSSLATQTKPKRNSRSFTSNLILALKEEMKEKDRESRKQQIALREKEREERKHELACWEASLFTDSEKEQMLSSWELPQIGLFLYLCQEPLNCGGIPHYEVERMVLLCQQSLSMALVMTSLLSTPYQRQYLDRKPPMPYEVWNAKLSHRLDSWYKTLQDCDKDFNMAADRLGIEHMFWHVVGRLRNPLLSKSFHELSFYQRIWIIKSLCDASVSTESSLRDVLDEQDADETRSYHLGTDSNGATYLHFPQFCGDHLRIYRLKPHQTTSTTSKRGGGKRKQASPPSSGTYAKTRALRGSPTIQVCDSPTSSVTDRAAKTSSDKENTQTFSQSDARALRLARRSEFYHGLSNHRLSRKSKHKRESVTVEADSADSVRGNPADESSQGCVSDETSSRPGANNTLPNSSDCLASGNSLNETPENVVKTETDSDPRSQRVEKQSESADVSSEQASLKEEEVPPKKEVEVKEDSSSVEEEDGLITEPTDFQSYRLICQSVEDLRELAQQFSGSRGREGELYDSLSHLLSELTPWETKLLALDTKAKEKMKRECESYAEQTSVAADGWESDSPASAEDDNEKEEGDGQDTGEQEATTTDSTTESASRKSKSTNRAAVSTPEPGNVEEDGQTEFGISAFGRIRKRRLIPNNAEPRQPISTKKVKRESKADTTESNTSTTTTDVIKQTSSQPAKVTDGYVVKVNKQLFMVPKEQLPTLLAQNKSKVQILNHPRMLSKANSPLSIKTLGPPARNVSIVRRAPATTCAGDVILAADTVKHVSTAATRLNSSANSILTSTNSTPTAKTTSIAGNNTRTITVLSSAISKQSAPNPTNSGIKTVQCSVTTASSATARSSLQLATNKTFTVKTASQINAMRNQNAAISVLPIRSVLSSKLMLPGSGNQKPVIISSRPPNCPPTLQTRKLLKATVSRKASDSASTLPITGVTNNNLTYATGSVSVKPAGDVTTIPVRNVTRAPVANAINGATHISAVTVSKLTTTATAVTNTTKSTNTAMAAISIASSNTLCTASTSSQSAATATSISNLDNLSRTIIQIPASVAQTLCVATAERPTLHSTSLHSVNPVKHGTFSVVRAATAPTSLPNSVKIVTNTDAKDIQHTQPNSSKSEIRYLTLSESVNLAGQTKTINNIATSAAPLETLKTPIIHTLSSKHAGRGVTVQNIGSPIQLVTSAKQHVRVVDSPTQQAFRVVRSPLQQSIRIISPPAQQPVRLVNSPLQQSIRFVQSPAQQTVRLVNLPATQPVRFVNMSVQQPVQLVKNLQPTNNSSAVQPATSFTETSCVSPASSSNITISTSTAKLSNSSESGSSNPEASAIFGRAVHVAGFERGKQHLVLVSDAPAPSVGQSNTPKISSSS